MKLSTLLLPTLRESPADAEVLSHRLMVRSGMIRKVAAGIYNLLPLGLRVIRKVEAIVRSEMDRAGAQEVLMPVVIPAELWEKSGRWDQYGKELLRLKDRHGRDFCLAPTHEEVVTTMVGGEVRSYRELPKNIYQIQTKFRDEIRPRFGLMRGREFIMKDAYSFHATDESAEAEYKVMFDTYSRIFERCGLEFRAVEADTGSIGGSFSHEFMVLAETGEDAVASCTKCTYAANVERAELKDPARTSINDNEGGGSAKLTTVSTPGMKSVEEVAGFLKVDASKLIKTLIFETDKGVVAATVRGDLDINESKLKRAVGAEWVRLAEDDVVEKATGAPTGFAGPVGLDKAGLKVDIWADYSVREIKDGVTGANKTDKHFTGVNPGRDFKPTYADLRPAALGDGCPRCDGAFEIRRGIEVGHIFKLGTKYSESMGATFLDKEGKERPMIMGCYGIGIGRTAAAAIEQNHDEWGIVWPRPLAPFDCHIVPVKVKDEETMKAAESLYRDLKAAGLEVLIDDRDERAGVKFKDADLVGAPVRVTVSTKTLKEASVEVKERSAKEATLVKMEEALATVKGLLKE